MSLRKSESETLSTLDRGPNLADAGVGHSSV